MVPTIWYFYLCVNGSDKCQPQIEIVCWVEDKRSVAHFVQWCAQLDTRSKRTLNGKIKGKIIESYFSCSILQIWRCPYLNKNNKIKIWFIERDGRQAIPLRREQQIIIKMEEFNMLQYWHRNDHVGYKIRYLFSLLTKITPQNTVSIIHTDFLSTKFLEIVSTI